MFSKLLHAISNLFNQNLYIIFSTKIYSGSKTGVITPVPTLFDICVRILQKNIDGKTTISNFLNYNNFYFIYLLALEYTGGVPFEILQPVLQRATPVQLYTVEEYNQYLLDDTEVLWEQHINRHYRSKKRGENETWRDMFVVSGLKQLHAFCI